MTKHKECSPKFDRKTAAQLREEIEELKLELLFRETEEEIYAQNALEAEQDARINEWMQRHVLQQIDAAGKPAAKRKILKKPILSFRMPTRIASICTASLIFFLVGSGTGFAAATFLQRQAGAFVMNQTDEALNFRFQMSPNTLAVPAEWQGEYFPSYIPDGFELVSISPIGVRYKNADGVEIEFMEMDPSAGFSMDSEHSVVSYERVGGRMAVISEWDNSTMIVFTEGDRILTVDVIDNHETGYTNKDVAMQIAESILLLQ